MTNNEETLFLLRELEKFGLSRYDCEKELRYSTNYIGQLLSKETNEKVNAALQMLLKVKTLEKELGRTQDIPKPHSRDDDFREIKDILKGIHSSLTEAVHADLLNQCLLKTNLLQSAKMESIVTKRDYKEVVGSLNEATAKIFDEYHCAPKKNKAHSVDA